MLALVMPVAAREWQVISSFSLSMASLDESGLTGHLLQHGAMSYGQHSLKGQALRSMQ